MCRKGAQRLIWSLGQPGNIKDISFGVEDLRRRVLDQFDGEFCLNLSQQERELYAPSAPLFGQDVEQRFPSIAEDISEAARCLALDRTTACVFHLMRSLEAVVQQLGDKLHAKIIDKDKIDLNWGVILENMKKPIEAMGKGPTRDKWSEALTLLFHVKQAWRHPTMHPKQTYKSDEARDVFNATGSFLRYLATLL
jgi:hypothetical protein